MRAGEGQALPRIAVVRASREERQVEIEWRGGALATVDLTGWIAGGGEVLADLRRAEVFVRATVGEYGASVTWDGGGGDLSIDAYHLLLLALEQQPFGAKEASAWQAAMGLSNSEAADLLGVVPSTWGAYKAGSRVPTSVAIACRAAQRDPLVMQAHYRPSRGRRAT